MSTDGQLLQEANACHDDDPSRAAALLGRIDAAALEAGERALLAFLLNHVLGEKLDDWPAAHARQGQLLALCGEAATPVLWRQAAVAAASAGDEAAATRATRALAGTTGVEPAQAEEMVALAALSFRLPRLDAARAAAQVGAAIDRLAAPHWQAAGALDAAAAAAFNNIASELSERPVAEVRAQPLRAVLRGAAECSQRLWLRCGDWVNHERACYGVAVAAAAGGEADHALAAARAGLALLDEHDRANEQGVDRAFLELEQAFALDLLGQAAVAAAARERSAALAAAFDDDGLKSWYAQRQARHAALRAG